jgi:hypothetical protein
MKRFISCVYESSNESCRLSSRNSNTARRTPDRSGFDYCFGVAGARFRTRSIGGI